MENKNYSVPKSFDPPTDVTKNSKIRSFCKNLKLKLWQKPDKKRLAIIAGFGIGSLIATGYLLYNYGPKSPEPNPVPEVVSNYTPPPTTKASPLTGVQVEPALAERAVTGIMIENSMDARPQSGLVDAGVVFEAIAEGGITRFLALFQEAQPDYIGPIRSARPYYVRWAAGFDAAYVHSGGSGEALSLIRTLGVKDMDHGNFPDTFDRISNRYAPHNVYTSMARLDALRAEKGFTKSEFTPFTRATEETPATNGEPANNIEFTISSKLYNTSYVYNTETKSYARNLAGTPHIDEKSGKQISPNVVIALIANYSFHPDGVHSVYDNVGSGKVLVFQNGTVAEGTWHKDSDTSSLSFKQTDGSPLVLATGQTWITAVPEGRVSFSP